MILVVDHYDSFVWNLVHYLQQLGAETLVLRHDDPRLVHPRELGAEAVLLSPGPCTPDEAVQSVALVRELAHDTPILGVCLGHQILSEAWGVPVRRAPLPVHGSAEMILPEGEDPLFEGLPTPFPAARYHSLILPADAAELGPLRCIARSADGITMAVRHREYPSWGVQFHPESVLTPQGMALMANFLRLAERFHEERVAAHG
jgi:para-aminobenzoate synthetase component 2